MICVIVEVIIEYFFFLKKKKEILVNFSAKVHLVSPDIRLKLTPNVERSFKYRQ